VSGTRTYQAYTMAEALAAVKYDLGPDAIILNTRSFKRGGLLGLGRRGIVEVTAASKEAANAAAGAPKAGNVAAQRAYTGGGGGAKSSANPPNGAAGKKPQPSSRSAAVQALASEADRQRTKRLAMAMQEQQRRATELQTQTQARPAATASQKPQQSAQAAAQPSAQQAVAAPASAPIAAAVGGAPAHVTPPEYARASNGGGAAANSASQNGNPLVVTVPATPMSMAAKRFILRSPEAVTARSFAESVAGFPANLPMAGGDETPIPLVDAIAFAPPQSGTRVALHPTPAGIVSIGAPAAPSPAYVNPARAGVGARAVHATDVAAPVQEELAAIRAMVGQVLQRQVAAVRHSTPSMPPKLFDLYLRLVGHDVSEELAESVIADVRERLSPTELDEEPTIHRAVIEHLADHLPVSPTPLTATSPNGRPLTIALVGPTGVGKTTTLAKLAASFKLKAGRKVGLITSDTYRIAAVDQLRTYANIIGLPLQVVLSPADMRQAVHALSSAGCEVILIDTAGRSQNDTMRIAELREFIDAAHPHEVHMVLSATAGEKVLSKEAAAFGSVGVNKVILTKIDEAVSLGPVVGMLRQINKPVSFITTGQEVPDHLEMAKSERLAELVLGTEATPSMGGTVHA
jgi:flagellar biosynthesis protein FlhF